MSNRLCDNEGCEFFDVKFPRDEGDTMRFQGPDGSTFSVRRRIYRSIGHVNSTTKREFFLCDVCHGAVRLVRGSGALQ